MADIADDFIDGDVLFRDDNDEFIVDNNASAPGDDDDNILGADDDDEDIDIEGGEEDEEDDLDEDADEDVDDKAGDKPGDDDESEDYVRGIYWKEQGWLAADTEIPKDITAVALEELRIKQVDKDFEARMKSEYADRIKLKGINPDEIFGENVNEDKLFLDQYKHFASLSYDTLVEKSKDVGADIQTLGREYYWSRNQNLTDEEVDALVDTDQNKLDEEAQFEKYQSHFATEAPKLEKKIQDDIASKKRNDTAQALADAKYIKEKLTTLKVGDRNLTPAEVELTINAIFKKDQIFDNGKGIRKTGLSLLEKRRMESSSTLDGQIEMAVSLVLKKDPKIEKEKTERINTVNTLEKLAKLSGMSKSSSGKKKTTKVNQEEGVLWLD